MAIKQILRVLITSEQKKWLKAQVKAQGLRQAEIVRNMFAKEMEKK